LMSQFQTRRQFNKLALALGSALIGTGLGFVASVEVAQAQGPAPVQAPGQPAKGPEFKLIKPAQTPDVEKGKIEVLEFFWFGCPHCNGLEPSVREWRKKLAPDVVFKRVHVPFREEKHQQLYYTLESMGKAEDMIEKVFYAMHVEHNPLDNNKKMVEWAGKQGIDVKLFEQTLDSFSVKTKMKKASNLATAYLVDGVPALTVNGKFYTAPSMAGSNGGALRLVDQFVEQERKAKK
jgi:protein dithiol oxidoreductase (disulfide-forming)